MNIVSYLDHKREDTSFDNPIIRTGIECGLRRWSVLPIQDNKEPAYDLLPKKPNGKPEWETYQYRRPTLDEITAWSAAPKIGVVTGTISGVVVLDVDPGGESALKDKHLPITPTVRTPRGGVHYYYKCPGAIASKNGILNKVDFKADGGYVVTPHSKGYEWIDGLGFDEIPLSEPPAWLMELAIPKKDKQSIKKIAPVRTANKSAPVALGAIEGNRLREWFKNDSFVASAAELLGIPDVAIGQTFKCIIPGHDDHKPSASLFREPVNNTIVYRDWHSASGEQWYTLPEIRASLAYGKATKLTGPEHAVWALRLLVETGHIQPAYIEAQELPKTVSPTMQKVYDGFVLLLSCKWLHTHGDPTPFAWRFASKWCDVSERKAGEAMQKLLRAGYIVNVGEYKASGRKMALFNLPQCIS